MSARNNKGKAELESDKNDTPGPEWFGKMLEAFEKCTKTIVDQMTSNFEVQNQFLRSEIFTLKAEMDELKNENLKLKQENASMKRGHIEMKESVDSLYLRLDDIEQEKLKLDLVIGGDFDIQPLNPSSISNFLQKQCDTNISPSSITSFTGIKTKTGQKLLKMTVSKFEEKLSILKTKKRNAERKVYINEVLTNQKYHLLMEGKGLCKEKKLLAVWSRNGHIFVKKCESSPPKHVQNLSQLHAVANN